MASLIERAYEVARPILEKQEREKRESVAACRHVLAGLLDVDERRIAIAEGVYGNPLHRFEVDGVTFEREEHGFGWKYLCPSGCMRMWGFGPFEGWESFAVNLAEAHEFSKDPQNCCKDCPKFTSG